MDNRKWEADAIVSPPTAPASPSNGYPTNGDPGAAQNATEPGAWWFHAIGEEIREVIVSAGLTPDHQDLTQLSDAILALITANIVTVPDASETVKGIVELATDAETQIGTDTVRAVTPAGLRAGLNASGNAPVYACRAWVNFNGAGAVAIRASGNVTSITDNGTGDYTINFTTAMPDANYSVVGMSSYGAINGTSGLKTMMRRDDVAQTVNATRITTALVNSGAVSAASDCLDVNVSIFR